eukprot:7349303-Pyramimonas_sp.AAC.1
MVPHTAFSDTMRIFDQLRMIPPFVWPINIPNPLALLPLGLPPQPPHLPLKTPQDLRLPWP